MATLELEATISATRDLGSHTFTESLGSFAVPDAGFVIPDLLDVGATLEYSIGGECTVSGEATVDFGGTISVPDTAQIVADYESSGASSVTGFDESQVTPLFNPGRAEASLQLSAFLRPEIKFGITLTAIGNADISVGIKLPELSATFTAEAGISSLFPFALFS